MPPVLVKYDVEGTIGKDDKLLIGNLKWAISSTAARLLSVEEWPLDASDFSISFLRKGRHDEMVKDFEVIILAHSFPARVEQVDVIAEGISDAITDILVRDCNQPCVEFSVSVILGSFGYKANKVFPLD